MDCYDTNDLAWAAGIFDGEGCFTIRRNKPTPTSKHVSVIHTAVSVVGMTHRPTIERLHHLFEVGNVTVELPRKKNHKPQWKWYVNGPQACWVAAAMYPWLITKKEEARTLIRMLDLGAARLGQGRTRPALVRAREKLATRLHKLKVYYFLPQENY